MQQAQGGAQGRPIPIKFTLQRELDFGQVHALVGSHPALGNWDLGSAPQMTWSEGHVWYAELELPPATTVEFKVRWQ